MKYIKYLPILLITLSLGCSKQSPESQKQVVSSNNTYSNTVDFAVSLIEAQASYQMNCVGVYDLLERAAKLEREGFSFYELKSSFKETDLSYLERLANNSIRSFESARADFDKLIINNKIKISPEFKEYFIEFGQILEKNQRFCYNLNRGEYTISYISGWVEQSERAKYLINLMDIECKKLLNEGK
mgnify:CR=1 FL=1